MDITGKEYSSLSYRAIKLLIVFSISYMCEKGFSALSLIIIKHRNQMDVNTALCLLEQDEAMVIKHSFKVATPDFVLPLSEVNMAL